MGARMQKLINSAESVLTKALPASRPRMPKSSRLIPLAGSFIAGPPRAGKVALISGGGSGHEPLHVG